MRENTPDPEKGGDRRFLSWAGTDRNWLSPSSGISLPEFSLFPFFLVKFNNSCKTEFNWFVDKPVVGETEYLTVCQACILRIIVAILKWDLSLKLVKGASSQSLRGRFVTRMLIPNGLAAANVVCAISEAV